MAHCHELGIAHRDLKEPNVLIMVGARAYATIPHSRLAQKHASPTLPATPLESTVIWRSTLLQCPAMPLQDTDVEHRVHPELVRLRVLRGGGRAKAAKVVDITAAEKKWRRGGLSQRRYAALLAAHKKRARALTEGADVFARFGGGADWYPARITTVRFDGSLDIQYTVPSSPRPCEPTPL